MTRSSPSGGSRSSSSRGSASMSRSRPSRASSRKGLTQASLDLVEERNQQEGPEVAAAVLQTRDKVQELSRKTKNLAARNLELETFRDAILKPYRRNLDLKAPVRKKGKARNALGIVLSDWHVGQVVDPSKISGLNEFNPEVCLRRVNKLCEKFLYLIECARIGAELDECYVFCVGDMINGYIHEELMETNSMSPIDEVFFAQDLMGRLLNTIQGEFKSPLKCLGLTGNHSRVSQKLKISTMVNNSYEKVLYRNLAKEFPSHEWCIAPGAIHYVNVYGRNYRFTHGTQVKYNGGVGGPLIPLNKLTAKWNAAKYAEATILGHLHMPMPLYQLGIVVNGCLPGYTEYGEFIGCQLTTPSQMMLVFDPDRGIVQCSEAFAE